MALVERRRRGGAVIVPETMAVGAKIAPSLLRAFKQWYDSYNQMSTNSSSQNTNGGKQAGNRRRQNKQRRQASGSGSDPSLSFPMARPVKGGSVDNVRFVLKDVVAVNNTLSTGSKFFYPMGAATNTTGGAPLGQIVPRFNTMAQLYRQFVINRLVVKWAPNAAFTASGSIAIGVDTSPAAGIPSDYGQVVHHNPSMLIDIKSPGNITYVPAKKDPRYTNLSTGASEDEVSYGVIQMFTVNNLGTGTPVGLMWFELDVTLIGPT
jgi:hypothetical protein